MSDFISEKVKAKTQDFIDFVSEKKELRIPSEKAEAKKLASWLQIKKNQGVLIFFHIPNERKASKHAIAELKRQGLQKGASDYIVFLKNGRVLAIELKRAKKSLSKVSKEQADFLNAFVKFHENNYAAVCYGANEAIEFIKENL